MRWTLVGPLLVVTCFAFAAACRPSTSTPEHVANSGVGNGIDSGAVPSLGTPAPPCEGLAGRTRIDSLERAARRLARRDGCTNLSDCRTAPLGSKACGGARDYLVYCARTTDTIALFRALADLERAERAANVSNGAISTCELRLPPKPRLAAGQCATDASGAGTGTDRPQ